MTYALVPIGLTALICYGFTWILSRAGLTGRAFHRQFWNSLLLITFFVTAILGIILAIQVNYKLEMPIVDQLLVWHVDFGIGMSIIALFHFSWHLPYYTRILNGKNSPLPGKEATVAEPEFPAAGKLPSQGNRPWKEIRFRDRLPLLSLGATAMVTQIILLREYLAIFHGNELVIGLILAGWLLLTGLGAMTGRNLSTRQLGARFGPFAFMALGVLPMLSVTGIRFFRNMAFPLGSLAGLPGILLYSLAGMALFCLLSGFMFTWLSARLSLLQKTNLLGFSYALESAGSIAAGILISFLLVFFLDTFHILFLVLLLNLWAAISFRMPDDHERPVRQEKWMATAGIILAVLAAVLVFVFEPDRATRSFLFENQELVETRDSPYGNLVVSRTGDQYNLFENSSPVSVTADIASVEEDVHYAMVQFPDPKNILVVSGNLSGIVAELEKYPIERVDFLELNPWITRFTEKYIPFPDPPWLNVIHQDGRRFLDRQEIQYDVVLLNLPPPGSAQLNRYYTAEFFSLLKSRLAPGAIVSVTLPGMENYLSTEAGRLYSAIYHTIKLEFENVLPVAGLRTYFLASDREPDIDIPSRADALGIETVYVNSFYLDGGLMRDRSSALMQLMDYPPEINRDFRPVAFFLQIKHWLSYFRSGFWILLGAFIVLILLPGFRGGALERGLFITGFTGMGIEVVILLAVQLSFGYVYHYTAVILTVFMMGLATGALSHPTIFPVPGRKQFALLQLLLACSVFLTFWWLVILDGTKVPDPVLHIAFPLLTFMASTISGLLFASAAVLRKGSIQSSGSGLYSADLAGSAAGALIMSVILIPLVGLAEGLLLLLLLNLLGFLYTLFSKRSRR